MQALFRELEKISVDCLLKIFSVCFSALILFILPLVVLTIFLFKPSLFTDSKSLASWSKYEDKEYEEGFRLKLKHVIVSKSLAYLFVTYLFLVGIVALIILYNDIFIMKNVNFPLQKLSFKLFNSEISLPNKIAGNKNVNALMNAVGYLNQLVPKSSCSWSPTPSPLLSLPKKSAEGKIEISSTNNISDLYQFALKTINGWLIVAVFVFSEAHRNTSFIYPQYRVLITISYHIYIHRNIKLVFKFIYHSLKRKKK